MAYQIILQPGGERLALWHSGSDEFVLLNATLDQIVDFLVEEYREDVQQRLGLKLTRLQAGEPAYHQFTMSWQNAVDTFEAIHQRPFNYVLLDSGVVVPVQSDTHRDDSCRSSPT